MNLYTKKLSFRLECIRLSFDRAFVYILVCLSLCSRLNESFSA